MKTLTVVFALWPPAFVAAELQAWARGLSGQSKARVMREESLHVTLAYVGRVPEADLARLVEAGSRALLRAHTLTLDHVERWGHNKILWVSVGRTTADLSLGCDVR